VDLEHAPELAERDIGHQDRLDVELLGDAHAHKQPWLEHTVTSMYKVTLRCSGLATVTSAGGGG
jgi:hypothetical protein